MFIEVLATNLSKSKRKPLYGVGTNDSDYLTYIKNKEGKALRCPFYSCWKEMLRRCYSESYQKRKPTYIGCSVAKEWLLFTNFKKWMKAQDWEGKQLDKDLLIKGNKIYSSSTCIFVPRKINMILNESNLRSDGLPLGVTPIQNDRLFMSQISINGKRQFLGNFTTAENAHSAYKDRKSAYILQMCEELVADSRLAEALKKRAENI